MIVEIYIFCFVCEVSGVFEDYIIGFEFYRFWGGILFVWGGIYGLKVFKWSKLLK